jgi:aldehyde:ferredoxin oxidoreductase
LPTRNFRDGAFPEVNKISAKTIKDTIRIGMEGCYACPVKCKKVVEVKEPYYVDPAYGGPEYETLGALGSNCGVDDVNAVSMASALCNAYALDTISAGGTIAFAMECFENGILTKEDTGGIDLKFGNADAMMKMVEMIAKREGIGDILAEGSARAAEKIGKGAEAYSVQVKKLEFPMHEPRLNKSLALGFMVNPHGADHCCNLIDFFAKDSENPDMVTVPEAQKLGLPSAPFDDIGPDKVAIFRVVQLGKIVFDTLAVCQFLPYSLEQLAKVTSAVTGWDISAEELLRASEKTLTQSRMFNLRQGFTAADDKLPERCFNPTKLGALKDTALDPEKLEKAKKHYYSLMGWDENGVPRDEKLKELGVS